jgi:GntR family transcriptional regulator
VAGESTRKAFELVADQLRTRIVRGEFAPGSQLPPGRELAAEYHVAPNTVLNAIAELRKQGLVESQQGRGTFVREQAIETAEEGRSEDYRQFAALLREIQAAVTELRVRITALEAAAGSARDADR